MGRALSDYLNPQLRPQDLIRRLNNLKRRIRDLERAPMPEVFEPVEEVDERANAILILAQVGETTIPDMAVITPGDFYNTPIQWVPVITVEIGTRARLTLYRVILTSRNVNMQDAAFDNTFTARVPFRMSSAIFHFPVTTTLKTTKATGVSPLPINVPGHGGDQWEFDGSDDIPQGGSISMRLGRTSMSFLYWMSQIDFDVTIPSFATAPGFLIDESAQEHPSGVPLNAHIHYAAMTGVDGTDWKNWIGGTEAFNLPYQTSHVETYFVTIF